jgi:integrase
MTAAPDLDIYLLPAPSPASRVVADHLVVPMHAELNARYGDDVWPLRPLTANPSKRAASIHWTSCPQEFRDQLRAAAWNLINGQLRPTFLATRPAMRSRIGADHIEATIRQWIKMAKWLRSRGISTLSRCGSPELHDYGMHLNNTGLSRSSVEQALGAVTRLWAFDQLSASPTGIGRPPWDELGNDDYLPQRSSDRGENTTEPLDERTIAALLVWAMHLVEDFADDIIAAYAEAARMTAAVAASRATPEGRAALEAYLRPLIQDGSPIPARRMKGRWMASRTYICAITGASCSQFDRFADEHRLTDLAAIRPGPSPLSVPITGQIDSRPWRKAIDLTEAANLMRHLGTAAFVVTAYLTGMRVQEVLGMRAGCCPDPAPAPATGDPRGDGWHLIRSREYKTATDEDGNHDSAGVEREVPWVAIAPVVRAIRLLERIVDHDGLLFCHDTHNVMATRPDTGSLKHAAISRRIADFVEWANDEAAAHQLPHQIISPDPHGTISPSRFRRSLAWHIARRPNGLVALAVQYGHLRTVVSGGYASRGRGGIHELLDVETVLAVADTVSGLREDLQAGIGVSGPAARFAITTAVSGPVFAGKAITATTARRLLANETAMLYDNPQALLLCHYKRDQALCHREGVRDTPSLHRCIPGCPNIIRTDRHAEQLRDRADVLRQQAAHVPHPVAERLLATAERLGGQADHHDLTRTVLNGAGR